MTAAERGLLLLCCPMEDGMVPLTAGQYKKLRILVKNCPKTCEADRELTAEDLRAVGCGREESERILRLLGRSERLAALMRRWKAQGIAVCTRLSPDYPDRLRQRLGDDAPPVLFLKGDRALLSMECVGLVGTRDLSPEGAQFAAAVGMMAARRGLALVSGNARGADQTAQNACLSAGGAVLAFTAERLTERKPGNRVLYLSEEPPETGFSAGRALRRNRLIHAMGCRTYVAQTKNGVGGTWSGTVRNLCAGWSPVLVYADGSEGAKALCSLGAQPVTPEELR